MPAALDAVSFISMGWVRVERWAEANLLSPLLLPAQLFSFLVIYLVVAELGCLPVGHSPWVLVLH